MLEARERRRRRQVEGVSVVSDGEQDHPELSKAWVLKARWGAPLPPHTHTQAAAAAAAAGGRPTERPIRKVVLLLASAFTAQTILLSKL